MRAGKDLPVLQILYCRQTKPSAVNKLGENTSNNLTKQKEVEK